MRQAIAIRPADPHAVGMAVQIIHAFTRNPWAFCMGHREAELNLDYDEYSAVVERLTQMRRTSAQIEAAYDRADLLLVGIRTGRLSRYGRVSPTCYTLPEETLVAAAVARCTARTGFNTADFAKKVMEARFNIEAAKCIGEAPWIHVPGSIEARNSLGGAS